MVADVTDSLVKSFTGSLAAAVDRAATMAAYVQSARARKRNRAESLDHDQRLDVLGQLARRYDIRDGDTQRSASVGPADVGAAGAAEDWYRGPCPIAPRSRVVRALRGGGQVVDLSWESGYQTYLPELSERYAKAEPNRRAAVRLFRHREPRPVVVLVHGYMGGHYRVEERAWPISWLFHKLGLDVALFTLPFHGARAVRGRRGPPPFPGSDPRMSNEGFRQAMGDLRDLVAWLREPTSERPVGVMGMSLGGYTTALAATLEPTLAFAIPVIPLTSLADFARDQGRLGSNDAEAMREHAALDRVHRAISPLHRERAIEAERILIVAARADRITPIRHAQRLASHFEAEIETWHGGHLLQFGRSDKFRRIGRFLDRLGVTQR